MVPPQTPSNRSIEVDAKLSWFRILPDGEPVDISRRGPARRIFARLCEERERAQPEALSVADLVEAGWPDEKLLPDSATARVYVTVRTLRRIGLQEVLQTREEGYLLDPSVPLRRIGVDGAPVGAGASTLPLQLTSFLGRDLELERLATDLGGDVRFITLLGPAGAGKTRLALRFAHKHQQLFAGGVWFCDLHEATGIERICQAVAEPLGVPLTSTRPVEQLAGVLAGLGDALLILDNFEQIVSFASATAVVWLERSPHLRVLLTSRFRTRVPGERIVAVDPLPESVGIELFIDRAQLADPSFEANGTMRAEVAELVRALDSLPLALELAAARAQILRPKQLLAHLDKRFELLGSPQNPERSLNAAISTSWSLLNEPEQVALAQLSVFSGGFDLDAVAAVIELPESSRWIVDVVHSLVDHSLVHVERTLGASDTVCFALLESVKEYAAIRLGELHYGAARSAEVRHGQYFAQLGDEKHVEKVAVSGEGRLLDVLRKDQSNLLTACERALDRADWALAARCVRALSSLWFLEGPHDLAAQWSLRVRDFGPLDTEMSCRLSIQAGRSLLRLGRPNARALFEEALEQARALDSHSLEVAALQHRAHLDLHQGELDAAMTGYSAALTLSESMDHKVWSADAHAGLAVCQMIQGETADARIHMEAALGLYREAGARSRESQAVSLIASRDYQLGHYAEAKAGYETALEINRATGNRFDERVTRGNLGGVCRELGDLEAARTHIEASLSLARSTGEVYGEGVALGELGALALARGDHAAARKHLTRSVEMCRELSARAAGTYMGSLALVHAAAGEIDLAGEVAREAEALIRASADRFELTRILCRRGILTLEAGAISEARELLEEAEALAGAMAIPASSPLNTEIEALRSAIEDGSTNS